MSDLLVRYRWFIVALFALPLLIAAGYYVISALLWLLIDPEQPVAAMAD